MNRSKITEIRLVEAELFQTDKHDAAKYEERKTNKMQQLDVYY